MTSSLPDTPGTRACIAAAHAAWPGVTIADADYVRELIHRLPPGADVDAGLASLHATDLYLALGCARGDAAAVAAFEAHYVRIMKIALRKLGVRESLGEELVQELRCQLFVGRDDAGPTIASYAGTGALSGWVRSIAIHAAFKVLRRERNVAPEDEAEAILERLPQEGDMVRSQLGQLFSTEFRESFAEAMASLEPRERNLLRQHFIDDLNIDEIGGLYGVHRATAARWLAKVRHKVLVATQRSLRRRLDMTPAELESLMIGLQSRLDITIRRHLAA